MHPEEDHLDWLRSGCDTSGLLGLFCQNKETFCLDDPLGFVNGSVEKLSNYLTR